MHESGIQDIPSGFRLVKTIRPHDDVITQVVWSKDGRYLASISEDKTIYIQDVKTGYHGTLSKQDYWIKCIEWSPDSRYIAVGSFDQSIRIYDVQNGTIYKQLYGHSGPIYALSWAPGGRLLASGSEDRRILIWDVRTGMREKVLNDHSDWVLCLKWSPEGGFLASGCVDGAIKLWDIHTWQVQRTLRGHTQSVWSLDWSPDGRNLASGSSDYTVRIWSPNSNFAKHVLEGHIMDVNSIAFSYDGEFLSSKSKESIHIWQCDTWKKVAVLMEQSTNYVRSKLSFHPESLALATSGKKDRELHIWSIDKVKMLSSPVSNSSIQYSNAKVVLLGDSGVGKSGLSLVLTRQPFRPTESTHARRILAFDSEQIETADALKMHDTLLWDLAGQPGYRLIHQLHLNEVAVALIVFDARSETDPFGGVRHWDRALRQAQQVQGNATTITKKFLVEARCDRGGVPVSNARIEAIKEEMNFDEYFRTSAKEGWGIDSLIKSIIDSIAWNELPVVSSTSLFQKIKDFIIAEKEQGAILSSMADLYRSFIRSTNDMKQTPYLTREFETCIGRVESLGLIRKLSFGNLVLLRPELLDAYASAIVNVAREEPDGLGCIIEEDARIGRFRMPDEERLQDAEQERLLLIATVEDLLRHEIALREQADEGPYLVFPSQFTREIPDMPHAHRRSVIFNFDGPTISVYSTLAVRLTHSGLFTKEQMWKNAAIYKARITGMCGISLRQLEEGRGELTLFYDEYASRETQILFEEFVETHLIRRSLPQSVVRRKVFSCHRCNTPLTDLQVERRRERGFLSISCSVCDAEVSLIDKDTEISQKHFSKLTNMDRSADARRDKEVEATMLQGESAIQDDSERQHLMELLNIKQNRIRELELQHAAQGLQTPPHIIIEIRRLREDITKLRIDLNSFN